MVLAIHIDYEEIPEAAAIQKSCKICGFFSKCSSINHLLDVMCRKIPAVSDYTLFLSQNTIKALNLAKRLSYALIAYFDLQI